MVTPSGDHTTSDLQQFMGSILNAYGHKEKNPEKLVAVRVIWILAETQGFEPWIRVLPRCTLSRGVPSTTRPRLRKRLHYADPVLWPGRAV